MVRKYDSHTLSEMEVISFAQTQVKDPVQPYLNIIVNGELRENIARCDKKKL